MWETLASLQGDTALDLFVQVLCSRDHGVGEDLAAVRGQGGRKAAGNGSDFSAGFSLFCLHWVTFPRNLGGSKTCL